MFGTRVSDLEATFVLREILSQSDHLGCISSTQAMAEVSKGLIAEVGARAPIGRTIRASWMPSVVQRQRLDLTRPGPAYSLFSITRASVTWMRQNRRRATNLG